MTRTTRATPAGVPRSRAKRTVDVDRLLDVFYVNHDGCLIQYRLTEGNRRVIDKARVSVGDWCLARISSMCCFVPHEAACAWIGKVGGKVRQTRSIT